MTVVSQSQHGPGRNFLKDYKSFLRFSRSSPNSHCQVCLACQLHLVGANILQSVLFRQPWQNWSLNFLWHGAWESFACCPPRLNLLGLDGLPYIEVAWVREVLERYTLHGSVPTTSRQELSIWIFDVASDLFLPWRFLESRPGVSLGRVW